MIFVNPFLVNRAEQVIPTRRPRFVENRELVSSDTVRRVRASRIPKQKNYRMTRGQAIAVAERNRKLLFPGGVLPAARLPVNLRNAYHPNATDLGDVDALPAFALPVATSVIGKVFARTPEQRAATITRVLSSPVISRLATRLGQPSVPERVASAIARTVVGLSVPVKPGEAAPFVTPGRSQSAAFDNPPAEFQSAGAPSGAVSFPAVDSTAAPSAPGAAGGAPSWLLPVAIAAGAFVFLRRGRRRGGF